MNGFTEKSWYSHYQSLRKLLLHMMMTQFQTHNQLLININGRLFCSNLFSLLLFVTFYALCISFLFITYFTSLYHLLPKLYSEDKWITITVYLYYKCNQYQSKFNLAMALFVGQNYSYNIYIQIIITVCKITLKIIIWAFICEWNWYHEMKWELHAIILFKGGLSANKSLLT